MGAEREGHVFSAGFGRLAITVCLGRMVLTVLVDGLIPVAPQVSIGDHAMRQVPVYNKLSAAANRRPASGDSFCERRHGSFIPHSATTQTPVNTTHSSAPAAESQTGNLLFTFQKTLDKVFPAKLAPGKFFERGLSPKEFEDDFSDTQTLFCHL